LDNQLGTYAVPSEFSVTAEFEAIARANAAFIESCVEATGELMTHLSAMDTAADVERIRQALSPNDGLVAYGASHGSQYGRAYLELYGEQLTEEDLEQVMGGWCVSALSQVGGSGSKRGWELRRGRVLP
jgi:hypothetical protein